MEVVGKIAVKRTKKEKAKKTWLTIGLIAFVIVMICEVLLGNYAFLALIVPFLYLLNLRNKMGAAVSYKDVVIRVENNNIEKKIEISNCEYRDKVLYSVRFTISDAETTATYAQQEEMLTIKCSAKKALFLDNTIVPVFEKEYYQIPLFVTLEAAGAIAKKLNCPLDITR